MMHVYDYGIGRIGLVFLQNHNAGCGREKQVWVQSPGIGDGGPDDQHNDRLPSECDACGKADTLLGVDASDGEYRAVYLCQSCVTRAFDLFAAAVLP